MEKETSLAITSESGQLLKMAIDKDLDVEKLRAIMDLRDREERRVSEREFENHFSEMQKDYIPAYKTKDVKTESGAIAYSYCPLPLILSVYAPILAKHGFSYRWEETEEPGKSEKITTCFLSGYGFSRNARIVLPYGSTNKLINPIQARGATSEYGRRYTFMNVTGCIVADEMDTDGVFSPTPESNASKTKPEPETKDINTGYEVIDEPIPKDYKDKKDDYRKKGFGCTQIDGQWKWIKYNVPKNSDPAPLAVDEPKKTSTATAATGLSDHVLSQIVDMVNEMFPKPEQEKIRTAWMRRCNELGDEKALKECNMAYEQFKGKR